MLDGDPEPTEGSPRPVPSGTPTGSDLGWRVFDVAFFVASFAFVVAISALYLLFALILVGSLVDPDQQDRPGAVALLYLPLMAAYVVGLVSYLVYRGVGWLVGRPEPRPAWVGLWTRRLLVLYPVLALLFLGVGALASYVVYS